MISTAEMLLGQSVLWLRKVTNLWCYSEVKFLSNDYTNPKILMTLTLTLTNPRDTFENFCAPVFWDFVWDYFCAVNGTIVTWILKCVVGWWRYCSFNFRWTASRYLQRLTDHLLQSIHFETWLKVTEVNLSMGNVLLKIGGYVQG